jgi:hypothetical protein
MNQVEGYKEYYERVQQDEDEDVVFNELKKKFPSLNEDLIQNKFEDDFYPDPTQEEIIYLLTNYFNKKTDLAGDQIIQAFVQNVVQPKKWAVEDVIAAFQEMENVQIVPLVKNGMRVEEYTVHPTVLKKEELLSTTKYIFADYTPLNHFQLIVRSSDKKGVFLQSEVPSILQRKMSESPILSFSEKKEATPPSPPAETPLVNVSETLPGMELEEGEEISLKPKKTKAKKVPVTEAAVITLAPSDGNGTRKISDSDAPEIPESELSKIGKMKAYEAYKYAVELPWGQHFVSKGYEPFTESTLKSKTGTISTSKTLEESLRTKSNDPLTFFKKETKKAISEKKKK